MRRKEKKEIAAQGVVILLCNIALFAAGGGFIGLAGSIDCGVITLKQFDILTVVFFAVWVLVALIRRNAVCNVENIKARHRRGVIANRSRFDRDLIEYRRAL